MNQPQWGDIRGGKSFANGKKRSRLQNFWSPLYFSRYDEENDVAATN
jgi:hypothetical protein